MIWIDLEHKRPTDNDIPRWEPWTQDQWDKWLAESKRLVGELAKLHKEGKIAERNQLIDDNSDHWRRLAPWLRALSFGKCWFSEAQELYSHYDVEHFRPKREAKGQDGTIRDGYWWLAFDYLNYRLCGNVGNRKKGGWFPLQEGSLCSSFEKQCEESETKFLLDPIKLSDVHLLAFDEEGKAVPAPGTSEWDCLRVDESVKRLKLNEHAPLTEARRKIWTEVSRLIEDIKNAKSRCGKGGNPGAQEKLEELSRELKKLTQPTSELSSVAKWCVILRNEPQLSRLVGD